MCRLKRCSLANPELETARPFGCGAVGLLALRLSLLLALLCSWRTIAYGQAEFFYYDPDGLGGHAFYNPQNMIVQGGLGAMYAEPVDEFDWIGGFKTVNQSIARPVRAVRDYGWKRFFYREFVPHLGPGQNYVPNWLWHFGGGGMRNKLLEEYYTHHGRKHPKVWAWLTSYTSHYLNEAVEAARFSKKRRHSIDAVADLYFFDWLGALVFEFDAVNRFMSGTLHQREWSYQAQYNPVTHRLFNHGQLYWLRLSLYGPLSISLLTGEQTSSLNLTFEWNEGRQLSVGAGPQTKGFIARNNGDADPSEIVVNAGVYYSIHDNPFAVLTYEPNGRHQAAFEGRRYRFTGKCIFNLYPSIVRVLGEPIGMTLAYHLDSVFVGFAYGVLPGAIALSTQAVHGVRQ